MIEFIEAILPPTEEPTFDTPEKAISHSQRAFVDITLGGQSIEECIGRRIARVAWSDTAFRLYLANGLALTLRVFDREIDAAVERACNALDLGESTIADSVTVRLGAQEFVWDRAALTLGLIGNRLTRLQLGGNDECNFLYVQNSGILLLSALIDRSSRRAFMFWSPTD